MEPIDVTAYVLHMIFAGLWTGSVLFLTYSILPLARNGSFDVTALRTITGKLKTVSRVSAVLLFVTGSHMAAARHTGESLTGTDGGYLVLSMLVLWAILMGSVEMGAAKLTSGTGRDKVREPARKARPLFLVAAVLSLLLLVNAGLLSAYNVGFL